MAFDNTPNRLESAFIQRSDDNQFYEQVNVSGSDLVIYHGPDGKLTADRVAVWAALYGIGTGGGSGTYALSASHASGSDWASVATQSWYATQSNFSTQSLTASNVPFNGNRTITRSDPDFQGINVGGMNVADFLNNFFFPFLPATIGIATGQLYYENGTNPTINIGATITPNQETMFGTGSVRKDANILSSFSIPPNIYSTVDSITSNHTYQAFAQVGNNGSPTVIQSSLNLVSFIYPFLYGMSPIYGLTGTSLYSALSKDITPFGNKSYTLNGTAQIIYFAYPSSYASLLHVYDPNLFDMLSSFEYTASVSVTSVGLVSNWTTNYKVYQLELLADPFGLYQFKFS